MNRNGKAIVVWLVIVFSATVLWQLVKAGGNQPDEPEISYSDFLTRVEAGDVAKVTVYGDEASGKYRDGHLFRVVVPTSQEGMLQLLHKNNVEIWFRSGAERNWFGWVLSFAPLVLLAILW